MAADAGKPWFRVVVRDTNSGGAIEFVERFADRNAAIDAVTRRGWTRVERVEETAAPLESRPDEARPAAPVAVLRREGGYAYLDAATAMRHPLYGVRGWAALLLFGLAAGPLLGIAAELLRIPDLDAIGIVAGLVFVAPITVYGWYVGWLLHKHRSTFRRHATILLAVCLAFSVMVLGLDISDGGDGRQIARDGRDLVLTGAWMAYVRFSRRIGVTTMKRVEESDAFLNPVPQPGLI